MIKVPIPGMAITHRDVFIMKSLYTMVHDWLEEYGYADETKDLGHKFIERLYLERRLPVKPGIVEKEWRIWWRTLKNPGGSSYLRFRINIYFFSIYIRDVEIVHEGKKISAHRGEIQVIITPSMEIDYNNRWENHPILKHFHKFFIENIYKQEIYGKRLGILHRDAYRLYGAVKNFLELKYVTPEEFLVHEKFEKR